MREPDLTGPATRAWRIRESKAMTEHHVREFGYDHGGIDTWVVNGPYHPFWAWWHVSVVHLRPIPGAPPAQKQYPEAEYEFAIFSLDPDPAASGHPERSYPPDIDALEAGDPERGLPGYLTPADAVIQFHGCTDEQAREVCELAVRAIVNGQSPDSDFRSWWERAIPNTVEHLATGGHEGLTVIEGERRTHGD